MHDKISAKFPCRTRIAARAAATNIIHIGPENRLDLELSRNSFRWRATELWNNLPQEIRLIPKIEEFKIQLKLWVTENVGIHP